MATQEWQQTQLCIPGDVDHRQWSADWTRSSFTCKEPEDLFWRAAQLNVWWKKGMLWRSIRSVLFTAWRKRREGGDLKYILSEITVFFAVKPSLHLIIEKLCIGPAHADWLSLMGKNCQIWQSWSLTLFHTWQCKCVRKMMGCLGNGQIVFNISQMLYPSLFVFCSPGNHGWR